MAETGVSVFEENASSPREVLTVVTEEKVGCDSRGKCSALNSSRSKLPTAVSSPKGSHGKGKDQTGRNGEDLVISVPTGTLVRDEETGEVLQDLIMEGQRYVAAQGGRGVGETPGLPHPLGGLLVSLKRERRDKTVRFGSN